jgi:LmbE family N-acetylglucosaminyl deacetylase
MSIMPNSALRTHYDALYLSPHLDDAALSCGGQIAQRTAAGQSVLIVTIMAGDPLQSTISSYAQSLHDRWALAVDAAAGRRNEDLAACRRLGAEALHWTVPDCIYRLEPNSQQPMYLSDVDIFAHIHSGEAGLADELAAQMRMLPEAAQILAPLTAIHRVDAQHSGRHVDHQIVRQAAELAFGERLCYYEDYPYVQEPGALEGVRAAGSPWRAQVIALAATELRAKIEAILAFRSQLSTFWRSRANLESQVLGYAGQVGGERVWYAK